MALRASQGHSRWIRTGRFGMTLAEWMRLVAQMQRKWPSAKLDEEFAAAWYEDVAHIELDEARSALRVHSWSDRGHWPPNGGRIARIVAEMDPTFDAAWDRVMRLVSSHGPQRPPLSPCEELIVSELGGWRSLRMGSAAQHSQARERARERWIATLASTSGAERHSLSDGSRRGLLGDGVGGHVRQLVDGVVIEHGQPDV